jgi:hypothetical protein
VEENKTSLRRGMEIYLSLKKCMDMEQIMQDTWSSKERKKAKLKGFNLKTYLVG